MSYNNKNLLFLAMAQGGQLTPEMMQMMQQSGQLPQMNMGAGLNDIQRMNMKQQSHYGNSMFRYGGVPYRADGGEQEQTDQEFLSPDKKYSGRVQDFLKQLKSKAMNVVQDEMLGTANDYDQEAMAIDMQNQMRYGGVYAPGGTTFGQQPTFDMSGINAANAFADDAQNQQDLTQGIATTAAAGTGLQGYWGSGDNFANNPLNQQYLKKSTITDLDTGKKERVRFAPGGSTTEPDVDLPQIKTAAQYQRDALEANAKKMGWINADGTADVAGYSAVGADGKQYGYGPQHASQLKTTLKSDKKKKEEPKLTPEQEAAAKIKTEQEARIAEETKKAEEEKKKAEAGKTEDKTDVKTEDKKTETKTEDKTAKDVGDGMDPWRALADPNSKQAGAYYQLDKKGHKIPMAFYDPNMRITSESAEYSHPIGNLFRSPENKKSGMMKKATYTFGSLDNATQVPDIQLGPNGAPVPNAPAPAGKPTWANQFFPQPAEKLQGPGYNGGPYSVEIQGGLSDAGGWARSPELDEMHRQEFANWRPGMQIPNGPPSMGLKIGPGNFTPGAQVAPQAPVVPQAPLTPAQARQLGRQAVNNAQANQQVAQQPVQPAPNTIPVGAPMPQFGPAQLYTAPQGRMNAYNQTLNLMNGAGSGVQQSYSPELLNSNAAGTIVQGNDGNYYFKDASGQTHSSNNQNSLTQKRDGLGLTGKRFGGEGLRRFFPGGPTVTEGSNAMSMDNALNFKMADPTAWSNPTAAATPGPTYGDGPLDKPMEIGKIYQTPGISNEKQVDNKYGKNNPFFAPFALGALDVIGGALGNKDKKGKARDKFSADQVYTTMNQSSGSRGDYDDKGNFRPNDYVPVERSGYNFQSNYAARGGEMNEGDEMYLDEETINAILAAGGQVEYLD